MTQQDKNLAYQEQLSAFRKGDDDRYPGEFAVAFGALESDPELAQWFEQDQQFDAGFRSALEGFAVPEPKPGQTEPARILRFPIMKLAAAAAIAFILGGFLFVQHGQRQDQRAAALVDEWRKDMAAFAATPFDLDAMNNDLSVLRDLITSRGGSFGAALDGVFANGLPMGCKVVDWDGRKVSLYCFGNDTGQVVHAFVVPLDELNGPRAARHLRAVLEYTERDTGGWVSSDTAYLLVSSMPGVDIKPFLLPAQDTYVAFNSMEAILPNIVIAMVRIDP